MKALFGQEKLDLADSRFYEYRNSPVPFGKSNNPENVVKTQVEVPTKVSETPTKIESENKSNKGSETLASVRSHSMPKVFNEITAQR